MSDGKGFQIACLTCTHCVPILYNLQHPAHDYRLIGASCFCYKRGGSIHIMGLHRHFLWVRLRILVMDKMNLEVWNRTWASCMQMKQDTFIFSCKGNLILLFFTKSKFNKRSRIIASSSWEMFRGDETILIIAGKDCFVLVASQTKWSLPLKIALMNWLFETWTR